MGLEVYYPNDIRNALLAAEQANRASLMAAAGGETELARAFQSGYRTALATVALAFGLVQPGNYAEFREWQESFFPSRRP